MWISQPHGAQLTLPVQLSLRAQVSSDLMAVGVWHTCSYCAVGLQGTLARTLQRQLTGENLLSRLSLTWTLP